MEELSINKEHVSVIMGHVQDTWEEPHLYDYNGAFSYSSIPFEKNDKLMIDGVEVDVLVKGSKENGNVFINDLTLSAWTQTGKEIKLNITNGTYLILEERITDFILRKEEEIVKIQETDRW